MQLLLYWGRERILVNPNTGTVRLFSSDIPGIGHHPPLELNPETNELLQVFRSDEELMTEGFIEVPYPPDSVNRGGVADLLNPSAGSNRGPVFGTPDHPLGTYSGSYHLLEAEGTANPFSVFSNFDYIIERSIPYQIAPDGSIRLSFENITTSRGIVSSQYADQADNWIIRSIGDIGYEPFSQEMEDDRPH